MQIKNLQEIRQNLIAKRGQQFTFTNWKKQVVTINIWYNKGLYTATYLVDSICEQTDIEATKINSDWYLWMHHTTNEIPTSEKLKYIWQKKHSENLSGTKNSYRPSSILDTKIKKKYDTWKK